MSSRSSRLRRHALIGLLLIAAAALLYGCLWLTDAMYWQRRSFGFLSLYPSRLALLALAATALLVAFAVSVGWPGQRLLRRRFQAVVFTTAIVLIALEGVFMFVAQSHNVGHAMAARIWWERYWGPENSLRYRDPEPTRQSGKKVALLFGDSFTAGAGIARLADRFGDVLASRRPDLQVVNCGRSGDDTVGEFARLAANTLPADVVVLQYYPNDIDDAAARAGHPAPGYQPYEDLPWVKLRFLIRGSFLANFVYWQFPHGDGRPYEQFLTAMHGDATVARLHAEDLARFCSWSEERHVPLVVVLFPLLEDLDWSHKALAYVNELFTRRHVPVLDVAELIGDLTLDERRVNHHDGHASLEVHRRIGEALAKMLPR